MFIDIVNGIFIQDPEIPEEPNYIEAIEPESHSHAVVNAEIMQIKFAKFF